MTLGDALAQWSMVIIVMMTMVKMMMMGIACLRELLIRSYVAVVAMMVY